MRVSGSLLLSVSLAFGTLFGCRESKVPEPVVSAKTDPAALKPGKSSGLVRDTCTPCHSARLVTMQHMSRQRWDDTITWMQEEHNLWVLPTNVRTKVLDYLVLTQGPLEVGQARDQTPWAEPLYRPNPIW